MCGLDDAVTVSVISARLPSARGLYVVVMKPREQCIILCIICVVIAVI